MARQQLDNIDLNILQKLADDGRKPYLEIARELGVSGAAIHQRLQRLISKGVVNGTECQIILRHWVTTHVRTLVSF